MKVPYNVKIEKKPQNSEGLINYDLTDTLIKCSAVPYQRQKDPITRLRRLSFRFEHETVK